MDAKNNMGIQLQCGLCVRCFRLGAPRGPMQWRSLVLVHGPRSTSSIQEELATLRVAVCSRNVHRGPLVPVLRFQRRSASEQLPCHLKVAFSDCKHERRPPVWISLVYDAAGFEERFHLAQVSLSRRRVNVDFGAGHDLCWLVLGDSKPCELLVCGPFEGVTLVAVVIHEAEWNTAVPGFRSLCLKASSLVLCEGGICLAFCVQRALSQSTANWRK